VAEAEILDRQASRLQWAIDNMPLGLCMFDVGRRLVVSNRQYAEMYRIPAGQMQIGMTLEEVLEQRIAASNLPKCGVEAFRKTRLGMVADGAEQSETFELQDVRTILIKHRPLPDGGWVAIHQDITEQRRSEERMHFLALHDPLTGLANRTHFRDEMDRVQERVRSGKTYAVFFLDLDKFKPVNDEMGHSAGDAILVAVADRIRECAIGAVIARLGGDEFAILQGPIEQFREARGLARQLISKLSEPFLWEGHQIQIGASVGVAMAPADGTDSLNLLRHADIALYEAKGAGRGRFHFFRTGRNGAPASIYTRLPATVQEATHRH
jgi:diguanylate cyclase (GGDEF)-like protein